MKQPALLKIIAGFIILFCCYHAAEYMMLFKNSSDGFLLLSFVFFIVAWLVAKWQGLEGLSAWGIVANRKAWKQLGMGLLAGGIVYGVYFLTSLALDIDRIKEVPPPGAFISQFLLFTLGTFFSSLSEDVFIRGYLYRYLHGKIHPYSLIALSSLVYLLNHIYRLGDGPGFWFYIFIIGVFLMLAMVRTGNIWLTLGLHWAGNIVYHTTHSVMHTEAGKGNFPGNTLYILFLLLLIPVTYFISKHKNQTQAG